MPNRQDPRPSLSPGPWAAKFAQVAKSKITYDHTLFNSWLFSAKMETTLLYCLALKQFAVRERVAESLTFIRVRYNL